MIRLHSPFERVVMVSPERITHVKPDYQRTERTRVYFDDDYVTVMESVEEVTRKVLEWRLAMERYRAYTYSATQEDPPQANEIWPLAHNVESRLMRLAGLEEPNHDAG